MAKKGKDYDRWVKAAAEQARTDNPLSLPYDVAVREAVAAAAFVKKYWEPDGERPGLKRVKSRLPASSSEELLSIVHAVQEAQTRLLLIIDPAVTDLGERARFLVDELESALEFLLDDDVDEPADAQLARLKEFHAQDGQRSSALSQALRDYAGLAESLEDRLVEADEEFDVRLIAEARKLAEDLQRRTLEAIPERATSAAATTIRNQLLHLMLERVGAIRKTAAHVFRRHPEIVREVTSAYERRRRAASRREKARKAAGSKPVENRQGAVPPPAAPASPAGAPPS
ncbi:hypothetical protein BE04_16930 [Sorangium cellulosum]|uniref:Uncharacterized protein n=2 Tax=Sorangium cellulosum TaxID=56 RepID=A0A150NZJ3_SORCE|nr:hypothetical protein [Sorangium cellulosum]AGP35269.1 hypothetical protein SCE1572_12530 [Sorangium cellulosum So0157-2]KYF47709.1 hypothetical protein BE04_16930 [Sorangium cellulosum]